MCTGGTLTPFPGVSYWFPSTLPATSAHVCGLHKVLLVRGAVCAYRTPDHPAECAGKLCTVPCCIPVRPALLQPVAEWLGCASWVAAVNGVLTAERGIPTWCVRGVLPAMCWLTGQVHALPGSQCSCRARCLDRPCRMAHQPPQPPRQPRPCGE